MKKTFILIWFLALSVIITSSSCSSNDDDSGSNNTATEIVAIENTMESGNWRVTYFFDTDSEETSNYNSYNFSFNSELKLKLFPCTNVLGLMYVVQVKIKIDKLTIYVTTRATIIAGPLSEKMVNI